MQIRHQMLSYKMLAWIIFQYFLDNLFNTLFSMLELGRLGLEDRNITAFTFFWMRYMLFLSVVSWLWVQKKKLHHTFTDLWIMNTNNSKLLLSVRDFDLGLCVLMDKWPLLTPIIVYLNVGYLLTKYSLYKRYYTVTSHLNIGTL